MPCTPINGPGFTGIVCTRGQNQKRCHYCNKPAPFLCDHPVIRNNKRGTCDVPLCKACRNELPNGQDLCRPHFGLWQMNGNKFAMLKEG